MILRGNPRLVKRVIEDIQDVYYSYFNRKTGKKIGMLQLMPREIKTMELVFPETARINIKKDIDKIIKRHHRDGAGGVAVHWGPSKKDKYGEDGAEII